MAWVESIDQTKKTDAENMKEEMKVKMELTADERKKVMTDFEKVLDDYLENNRGLILEDRSEAIKAINSYYPNLLNKVHPALFIHNLLTPIWVLRTLKVRTQALLDGVREVEQKRKANESQ
jgi:hypothetical protein